MLACATSEAAAAAAAPSDEGKGRSFMEAEGKAMVCPDRDRNWLSWSFLLHAVLLEELPLEQRAFKFELPAVRNSSTFVLAESSSSGSGSTSTATAATAAAAPAGGSTDISSSSSSSSSLDAEVYQLLQPFTEELLMQYMELIPHCCSSAAYLSELSCSTSSTSSPDGSSNYSHTSSTTSSTSNASSASTSSRRSAASAGTGSLAAALVDAYDINLLHHVISSQIQLVLVTASQTSSNSSSTSKGYQSPQQQLQMVISDLADASSVFHQVSGQLLLQGLDSAAVSRWARAVDMLQLLLHFQQQRQQQQQQPALQCTFLLKQLYKHQQRQQRQQQEKQQQGAPGVTKGVTGVTPGDLLAVEQLSAPAAAWLVAQGGHFLLQQWLQVVMLRMPETPQQLLRSMLQPQAAATAAGSDSTLACPSKDEAAVDGGGDCRGHGEVKKGMMIQLEQAKVLEAATPEATGGSGMVAPGQLSPSSAFVSSIQLALKSVGGDRRGYSNNDTTSSSSNSSSNISALHQPAAFGNPGSMFHVEGEYQELYHWHIRSELKPVYLLQVGWWGGWVGG